MLVNIENHYEIITLLKVFNKISILTLLTFFYKKYLKIYLYDNILKLYVKVQKYQ